MIHSAVPWRAVMFRNNRVLARCDDAGKLSVADGRVEIRYKPDDGRAYRASARNLVVVEDAPILPCEACSEAVFVGARKAKVQSKKEPKAAKSKPDGEKPSAAIVAYTDGACSGNPGPAGLGVVLVIGAERREISGYLGRATNNIAELTAIKCALDVIGKTTKTVRIYTDSRYAIGVLSEGWTAKANQALVTEIKRALETFPNIRLIYVPGHAGHPQNERADELARQAIRNRAPKAQC